MNTNKTLRSASYPEAMRSFARENLNLKFLLACLVGLLFLLTVLVMVLVKRGPTVVALDDNGRISKIESSITDLQIRTAIEEYLSYRYSWRSDNFGSQIAKARFYVMPSLVSAFDKSMIEVQKFVREKKVTQRVYPKKFEIDIKTKKVLVIADRITEFENLKAATEMKLTLQFVVDDRTVTNPWGVYVSKETEEARP